MDEIVRVRIHGDDTIRTRSGGDSFMLVKTGASSDYVLPEATETTLGGIKVGEALQIENGVLSVRCADAAEAAHIIAAQICSGLPAELAVQTEEAAAQEDIRRVPRSRVVRVATTAAARAARPPIRAAIVVPAPSFTAAAVEVADAKSFPIPGLRTLVRAVQAIRALSISACLRKGGKEKA